MPDWKEEHLLFLHAKIEDLTAETCPLCKAFITSREEGTLDGGTLEMKIIENVNVEDHLQ